MYTKTADGPFLNAQGCIGLRGGGGIERDSLVPEDKLYGAVLDHCLEVGVSVLSLWISIHHHIGDGLLKSKIQAHRKAGVNARSLTDLIYKAFQLRDLAYVVVKGNLEDLVACFLLPQIVDEKDRYVVALGGFSAELPNGFGHAGHLLAGGTAGEQHLYHPLLPKQLVMDVLRFRNTVRVQEDCVVVADIGLLLSEGESRHYAKRDVGVYGQFPYAVREGDGGVMTGVAIHHMAGLHIQDAAEEGHEH